MNNYQKAVMNCYVRFMNIWIKKYRYDAREIKFILQYNYLLFYTNKTELPWDVLEELKIITDKNNTSWYIQQSKSGLIIKFQK